MDRNKEEQGESFDAYETGGEDRVLESTSSAVGSPSQPSKERTEAPDPYLSRIGGRTPGSDNPALDATRNFAEGGGSTADMLRERETAEEEHLRRGGDSKGVAPQTIGADHVEGLRPDEYQDHDAGRPTWPNDRKDAPLDYMNAPRADMPLGSGTADFYDVHMKGRMDRSVDSASTEASKGESRSGLPATGFSAEEDKYEEREFERPTEMSETEMFAPKMKNIPSGDE
jgi:hypothetical protein